MTCKFKVDGKLHEVWTADDYHLLARISLSLHEKVWKFFPTRTSNFTADQIKDIAEYMNNLPQ